MDLFNFPINSFSPIDEQIYIQLKNLIIKNKFNNNPVLPSPRNLAIYLKEMQADISSAYRQLEIEGYIEKKDDDFIVRVSVDPEPISEGYGSEFILPTIEAPYDFLVDVVDKQHFPLKKWQGCLIEASEDPTIYTHSDRNGEPILKDALADYFKSFRNFDVSTSNIFINSSIRALLIRLGMFFKEKGYYDAFITENPGNKHSYALFKTLEYDMSTFPVTEDGHQIDMLEDKKSILYISPSQHQILGNTIPVEQRVELIAWANWNNSIIIEDDTNSEFRYNGRSISPFASKYSEHIIYLGTFANSFLPAAKIAYIVLPDKYVEEFSIFNARFEQNSSAVLQITMANFINKGYLSEHMKKMAAIYEQKMTVLATKIQTTLPPTVSIYGTESGQYLAMQPNNGMTEDELVAAALKIGVVVYRGSEFFLEDNRPKEAIIILGFGKMARSDFITGIERLKQAWFSD